VGRLFLAVGVPDLMDELCLYISMVDDAPSPE
jgi:hypothetical protein